MSLQHVVSQWVTILPLLTSGLPLLLACCMVDQRLRSTALRFAPWAAAPAVAFALWPPASVVEVPWLLLGTRLGVDPIAQRFLFFTSLLWTCAGAYARGYLSNEATQPRFFAFFLVALSGNFGVILAHDVVSFYFFFALMSFASYGLVVHDGSEEARYAGRIYLILVVIGEVLLVSALLLLVSSTGNVPMHEVAARVATVPLRDVVVGLLLAGFGIKAGALPLHVWLPLAHPVAPTPASAVLSGAMIKAGLLGWLRFLPLGEVTMAGWGNLCISMGITAAFFGVAVGVMQNNAKTVLAYSSISQMGLMTVALGIGLATSTAWPLALSAVLLYALHHALAKGALFLSVGLTQAAHTSLWLRRLFFVGVVFSALALAGAPLTSGAIAKSALKTAIALAPDPWPAWLSVLLPVAAVGTTVLMGRFVWLLVSLSHEPGVVVSRNLWVSWAIVLVGVAVSTWFVVPGDTVAVVVKTFSVATVWPILLGVFCTSIVWRGRWRLLHPRGFHIPAGDLLIVAEWLVSRCHVWARVHPTARISPWLTARRNHSWFGTSGGAMLPQAERWLGRWATGGTLFLLLLGVLLLMLVTS